MNDFLLSGNDLAKIQEVLSKPNGVIAFPTDTVWGVGCHVFNKQAVERIYSVKGRSKNKPLILLGSKIEHLVPFVASIPDVAKELIEKHLPGALTLILPKSPKTPYYITAGFDTVGIRIPACPVFLEMLDRAVDGHVLATTSANVSGEISGKNKDEVVKSLGNDVDYVLDDYGFVSQGIESTIVSVENNDIKILRQGSIRIEL